MASERYKPLLTEIKIGAITLRNRVIMSPLTRNRSLPSNVPNAINLEYYQQRAAGGAGLIISEGTLVTQQGTEWEHAPGIWNQEQIVAWKKITDAVHAAGGAIFCQLWHLGRVSHPDAPEQKASGQPVYAPSAIAAHGGKFRFLPGIPGYVTPTPIDDPRTLIALYKQAAINAKEAGFDGVELHGSGGYLIHQFLDNTSNLRTDEWGGSIENRARFGLEVLREVVEVWGADRVAVKLMPAGGFNDMGMTLVETIATYGYFIEQACALGLAYIMLLRYSAKLDATINGKLRATQHDVLTTYRPFFKAPTKLILNGDLTPEESVSLIASGAIDAPSFGWLWISHPDLALRLERDKPFDTPVDVHTLYNIGEGIDVMSQLRKGYSDYPFAE